jgi:RimJ/RimL family protein N-acetyltransferase
MKKVELVVPKIEDLAFRQKCLEDSATMAYNAGYDVPISGYHFDTGCIDFPSHAWADWYNRKMTDQNFYFAFIKDVSLSKLVGFVNFSQDSLAHKASMGIVVHSKFRGQGYMRPAMQKLFEAAKARGVECLTDDVPASRSDALKVFFDIGFVVAGEFYQKKFNKSEKVLKIEKKL